MAEKSTKKSRSKTEKVKLPTVKEMLEAGAHFGHETQRWNPNFTEFIYIKRGKFHIIDLEKTLEKFKEALEFLKRVSADGDILIVGTKRQARDIVKEEAVRCGAHFVINRWVGGLVTNFEVISKGIKRLKDIEEKLSGDLKKYSQRQLSVLRREWARLDRLFGGVKSLQKLPDVVVIIDAHYEKMALREAKVANVPIIAIVDSNTDPVGVDYPIPANDDAIKSIQLFVRYLAEAILAGNKGNGVKHKFKDFSTVGVKKLSKAKKDLDKKKKTIKETIVSNDKTKTKKAKLKKVKEANKK